MPMNRLRLQPGLPMAEFLGRYGSEAALVAARWPDRLVCPSCGAAGQSTFVRGGRRYWQRSACRHKCSAISGTVFESTKPPVSRWLLAMHLLTQAKSDVAALEPRRQFGVCYKPAWLLKREVLEATRLRERVRQLAGRAEVDDAYCGGGAASVKLP